MWFHPQSEESQHLHWYYCTLRSDKVCSDLYKLHHHHNTGLLITESECTDENDNILHGSSDASLTQQLTEDRDLSAELTQVPLVCLFIAVLNVQYIVIFIHCSYEKYKNSNVNNSITNLTFTEILKCTPFHLKHLFCRSL